MLDPIIFYCLGAFVLLVGFVGWVGNLLIVYVFFRSKHFHHTKNVLTLNLAITNVLMCLATVPTYVASSFSRKWIFSDTVCQMTGFMAGWFGTQSICTLAAIALDRCIAITMPLTGKLNRGRRMAVSVAVVWLWSLVWCLPPFFGWNQWSKLKYQTSCTFDYLSGNTFQRWYIMALTLAGFVLPMVVMVVCYYAIWRAARRSTLALKSMMDKGSFQKLPKKRRQVDVHTAKIGLLVTMLFILAWTPFAIVALIGFAGYGHLLTLNPLAGAIPAAIAKGAVVVNFVVYAALMPDFQRGLREVLPWMPGSAPRAQREFNSRYEAATVKELTRSSLSAQKKGLSPPMSK
ncbi:melanopsin-like [Branchiostoma floridae x Branchiostoma belcheri]